MPEYCKIKIPVTALTPVWTGDADRKTSYIKASSVLGGLRFWTEALMRSLGKDVCNITDDKDRCIYEEDNKKKVCDVCRFFGCTGLGRSFSLKISGGKPGSPFGRIQLDSCKYESRFPDKKTGKPKIIIPRWFLDDPGIAGNFLIEIAPLRHEGIAPEAALSLMLMLTWGSVGARDQYGHGVVNAEIPDSLRDLAAKAIPDRRVQATSGLSLQDFFFFRVTSEKAKKELPFEIRCHVRNSLRDNRDLRHYFCGTIDKKNKCATKYNIALADGGIRGWGFFEKSGRFGNQRDRCISNLKKEIIRHCGKENLLWREFGSDRDTGENVSDWPKLLKQLWKGEGL